MSEPRIVMVLGGICFLGLAAILGLLSLREYPPGLVALLRVAGLICVLYSLVPFWLAFRKDEPNV